MSIKRSTSGASTARPPAARKQPARGRDTAREPSQRAQSGKAAAPGKTRPATGSVSVEPASPARAGPVPGDRRPLDDSALLDTGRGASAPPGFSQNDWAYTQLQQRLTTHHYRPGEYLNTAVLMADLALGRTPINHALHRLETEGLVRVIPRKGVMVVPLSLDDALAMIEVRQVNEGLCARLAAERISAAGLIGLQAATDRFEAALAARDLPALMECDRDFHERIADASGNPVLVDMLRVLHARSQRFWAISLSAAGHARDVCDEHRQILAALQARDGTAAERAVIAHILSFRQALLGGR